jgi:hypothetical protein
MSESSPAFDFVDAPVDVVLVSEAVQAVQAAKGERKVSSPCTQASVVEECEIRLTNTLKLFRAYLGPLLK